MSNSVVYVSSLLSTRTLSVRCLLALFLLASRISRAPSEEYQLNVVIDDVRTRPRRVIGRLSDRTKESALDAGH